MLKFMLDTNICIFTIKNKPTQVRDRFNLNRGRMCISSVTLMELVYGAEKSQMPERNLAVCAHLVVILISGANSIHFTNLRQQGKQYVFLLLSRFTALFTSDFWLILRH